MSKKTIAVDIDDVLAINVPAFIEFSNQRWKTNLTIEDFTEDWRTMWEVDTETLAARVKELDDQKLVAGFEHFKDATETLAALKRKFKLVITTSRRRVLIPQTTDWINNYFPDLFEEIHHAGIWDKLEKQAYQATKAELCRQIGADYLIDDHPKHCFAAAEAGIPSLLFGEYPWNKGSKLPDGVSRVKNWQEVGEYFCV